MKIKFDVWARLEGVVEADNPHQAFHLFDRAIRRRLRYDLDSIEIGSIELNTPLSIIRCYDCSPTKNLEPGDISTYPCPDCEKVKNG